MANFLTIPLTTNTSRYDKVSDSTGRMTTSPSPYCFPEMARIAKRLHIDFRYSLDGEKTKPVALNEEVTIGVGRYSGRPCYIEIDASAIYNDEESILRAVTVIDGVQFLPVFTKEILLDNMTAIISDINRRRWLLERERSATRSKNLRNGLSEPPALKETR